MSTSPTCVFCGATADQLAAGSDEPSFVCKHCERHRLPLLDDDGDDGRPEARHLTILSIDVDE